MVELLSIVKRHLLTDHRLYTNCRIVAAPFIFQCCRNIPGFVTSSLLFEYRTIITSRSV